MFLSKKIANILFGVHTLNGVDFKRGRETSWDFPKCGEDDKFRRIEYPVADGLILYLIKRIEKLEDKINGVEEKSTVAITGKPLAKKKKK